MGTFIVFGIIATLFVLSCIKILRDKKKGVCCGCSNKQGCSNCKSNKN